jgi:hypothetical protein
MLIKTSLAFMSVETGAVCTIVRHSFPIHCSIVKLNVTNDLKENILATYELERLQIYDVVVTPNAERFLGVAALLESKDKLKPAKSRPENRIIGVFRLRNQEDIYVLLIS